MVWGMQELIIYKEYCTVNRPDILCVAEPMVPFVVAFSFFFWNSLGFRIFPFNDKGLMDPRLWVLANSSINGVSYIGSDD